ncbi:hypothetical protein T02_13811 [Trichinella nativa]|uniref:Uncharacterized protein n=1 Tax=Trichinella nativa TaxID=6335 RepID=A0A0V1LTA4_9BILA|nr:hypothetical protein T02_13811 [Trichinella nativa]
MKPLNHFAHLHFLPNVHARELHAAEQRNVEVENNYEYYNLQITKITENINHTLLGIVGSWEG